MPKDWSSRSVSHVLKLNQHLFFYRKVQWITVMFYQLVFLWNIKVFKRGATSHAEGKIRYFVLQAPLLPSNSTIYHHGTLEHPLANAVQYLVVSPFGYYGQLWSRNSTSHSRGTKPNPCYTCALSLLMESKRLFYRRSLPSKLRSHKRRIISCTFKRLQYNH